MEVATKALKVTQVRKATRAIKAIRATRGLKATLRLKPRHLCRHLVFRRLSNLHKKGPEALTVLQAAQGP